MEEDFEKLYQLQLRIKKNSVNEKRKKEEAKRLKQSFVSQLRDMLTAYSDSAKIIWHMMEYEEKGDPAVQIPKSPKPTEAKDPEFTKSFESLQQNLESLRDQCQTDMTIMPQQLFLQTLSLFSFLWSKESCFHFLGFLKHCGEKTDLFMQCFLANPHVQIFFSSALVPFLSKLQYLTEDKLFPTLKSGILMAAPMIPDFFKEAVMTLSSNPNTTFARFFKFFFHFFAVFNLEIFEFDMFFEETFKTVEQQMLDFLATDDGNEYIKHLFSSSEQICIIPSEELLLDVNPKASLTTIAFLNEQPFFVNLNTISKSTYQSKQSTEDTLTKSAIRILLKAKLIRLDRKEKSTIDYFDRLSTLSSVSGDSSAQMSLERLDEHLKQNPMTLAELCKAVTDELNLEETLLIEDPLKDISRYSSQNAYIQKLIEFSQKVCNNGQSFFSYKSLIKQLPAIEVNRENFVSVYTDLVQQYQQKNPLVNREIHSYLVHTNKIMEQYFSNEELQKEDMEMHKFIGEHSQELIDMNKQDFLEAFKKDKSMLKLFFEEFEAAFSSKIVLSIIEHIHAAYQLLNGLLKLQNINEIGADQILPFVLYATTFYNPKNLITIRAMFSEIISPLFTIASPLDHSEEYTIVQFVSTTQYFVNTKEGFDKTGKITDPTQQQD